MPIEFDRKPPNLETECIRSLTKVHARVSRLNLAGSEEPGSSLIIIMIYNSDRHKSHSKLLVLGVRN